MNVYSREAEPGFRFLDESAPTPPSPRNAAPRKRARPAPVPPAESTPAPPSNDTMALLQQLPSLDEGLAALRGMVRTRPWLSLALGVAAGLAVAGGLATRGGRAVLVTCGRYALRSLLARAWRSGAGGSGRRS